MKIDWPLFRKQELQNWRLELEDGQKRIEFEIEKQQKIREKYMLRWQVTQEVKSLVSPAAFERAVIPYQRKKDQVNQEVRAKLQELMQELELIEALKRAIDNALNTDLSDFPNEARNPLTKDQLSKAKLTKKKVSLKKKMYPVR